MRYIAFDVETPNRNNNRMSAIGISVVEEGMVRDEWYSLIDPETHFDYFNTRLTGIDEYAVKGAPTFPEAWEQAGTLLDSGIVVAHNAVFDLGVLKKCLAAYEIGWKDKIPYLCTVQLGRRFLPGIKHNLNCMCDYYGIDLDHHRADSDSRACAEILLRYMQGGCCVDDYIKEYQL